jgi:hypothetical protein
MDECIGPIFLTSRTEEISKSHLSASCLIPKTIEDRWESPQVLIPQPHITPPTTPLIVVSEDTICQQRQKQVANAKTSKTTCTFAFIPCHCHQNQQLISTSNSKYSLSETFLLPRVVGFYRFRAQCFLCNPGLMRAMASKSWHWAHYSFKITLFGMYLQTILLGEFLQTMGVGSYLHTMLLDAYLKIMLLGMYSKIVSLGVYCFTLCLLAHPVQAVGAGYVDMHLQIVTSSVCHSSHGEKYFAAYTKFNKTIPPC